MKKFYLVLLLLMTFSLNACGFEIVDTGYRGVETRYGEVVGKPLPEGLHFYNPFTSNISEMDVRTKKYEATLIAKTEDNQEATISFALNYNLEPAASGTVFQTVGSDYADILIPQDIEGAIKAGVGQWVATDIVNKREELRSYIQKLAADKLADKNIIVTHVELQRIVYNEAFQKSIDDKVIAVNRADEAKNHTVRIEEEARQKIVAAEAEARSMQIRGDSLAKNGKLVEWEAVQKWNGVLPQYMLGGDGAVPFIDIGAK